jgi:hypothetical protein
MNDKERYRKELDLLFQELDADALRGEQVHRKDRETAWRFLEQSFAEWADRKGLTPTQRQVAKETWLDLVLSDPLRIDAP